MYIKTALIAPIALLPTIESEGVHMALASQVLQYPEYAKFYRERSRAGKHVILDNSAHELLKGLSEDHLKNAIDLIEPTEFVLPDRLFFGMDTVRSSERTAQMISTAYPKLQLMGCPQGRTHGEYVDCLTALLPLCTTIGISKDYEVWPHGLRGLVDFVPESHDIHLLGLGREPVQLLEIALLRPGRVRSVDSAKPYVYAWHGLFFNPQTEIRSPSEYPGRSENYFTETLWSMSVVNPNVRGFKQLADPSQWHTEVVFTLKGTTEGS